MFNKIKISLVPKEEKFEKVKLVQPNMIYNRFDIKYNGCFEVLEIEYKNKLQYIAIHINDKNICYIGIYMTELEQIVFDKILKFLTKNFKNIKHIHITQGLIDHPELSQKMHWLLELPNSIEEYNSQFSSRTRYNRRSKLKKLEENYDVEFLKISKNEINENLIKTFINFKQQTEKDVYYDLSQAGIKKLLSCFYNITDAVVMKINSKIEAIVLYSITSNKDVYQENLAYNKEFSGYYIGILTYYYGIEKLIESGYKRLYLGGGDYDYKKNSKAIQSLTKSGNIIPSTLPKNLKRIFDCKNTKTHKVITILGIKIKIRIKKQKFIKIPIIGKYFLFGKINGNKNKILTIYNDKEHKIRFKHPNTTFQIKGNNNVIKFHFKTNGFPEGLDLTINGSNNKIDIYKSKFKDTYIQIYRNDNRLVIKEQNLQTIKDAYIYVSYGGSMFIGKNCELGNGGLQLAVAGDYIEKHKLVIGDNTHIARDVIIRTSDGQSLIDPETMLPTDPPQDVIIGNHVWIMSRCILLKGSYLADGCAVAANSLVNKKFEEENLLICGTPAKIIKHNIRWGSPYGKYMENLENSKKGQTNETL